MIEQQKEEFISSHNLLLSKLLCSLCLLKSAGDPQAMQLYIYIYIYIYWQISQEAHVICWQQWRGGYWTHLACLIDDKE